MGRGTLRRLSTGAAAAAGVLSGTVLGLLSEVWAGQRALALAVAVTALLSLLATTVALTALVRVHDGSEREPAGPASRRRAPAGALPPGDD